ncbi:MAG: 6,7-dimethyl-8-ribityllumazine synthase [Actinomycetota bacterium]|jgi:6,7-dimethyl-8-ribityllumazine synthase|nr:6,7-dimethyl-8-ribityllumazine synthase [Actinomycetota bacterium]
MKIFEGQLNASGIKFGIIVTRYHEFITNKLLGGSIDCLKRHGASEKDISVAWVPGAFEIPATLKVMAESKKYDALICLGSVMKGETSHNQYITSEVIKGVAKVNMDLNIPVSFGVITPDTLEQAIERAGTSQGNKGWDAALTAIEMTNLMREIKKAGS